MIPWWVWAFCTVIIWGFHYNFINKATQLVSPVFIFILPLIPLLVTLPFYYQTILKDINTVLISNTQQQFFILITSLTGLVGTMCLFKAIATSGNPTMAALVEISYPIFIAIVAYFLFKETQLTPQMMVGGAFVLFGSALIIWNSNV